MKLDRLHLNGFGKFNDKTLELGPGLNLIYGENESGKSTLQHFLRGMLFGLKKPGTRRSYDELLERYRPWNGGIYAGVLEYTLEQGNFRVERNFEPDEEKVRVLDGVTWQDITAQFGMDRRKEVLFAQEQLGISQVIFDNTVCVRQLNSKSSGDLAAEISTRLANLASAGEEDVSVQNALQVLEANLREIGLSERSSRTPLGKVSAKVEELEQARQQTLSVYEEIRAAEAYQHSLVQELAGLEESRRVLLGARTAIEAKDIEARLQKVTEYDKKLQEVAELLQTEALRDFPLEEKDHLLLALDRQKRAEHMAQVLAAKGEELARRVNGLRQALSALEVFAAYDQESVQSMEGGFTRLEAAAQQAENLALKRGELADRRRHLEEKCENLSGCAKLGTEGEAEVNRLEDELHELKLKAWSLENDRLKLNESNLAHKVKFRSLLALSGMLGGLLLGFGLGVSIHWSFSLIGLVGLVLSIGQLLANRRDKHKLDDLRKKMSANGVQMSPVQQDIEQKSERVAILLAEAGVKTSRELYEKMRQWALLEHTRQTLLVEVVELEDQLGKLRQRVREEAKYLVNCFLAPTGIVQVGRNITRADLDQFTAGLRQYRQFNSEMSVTLERQKELGHEQQECLAETAMVKGEIKRILDKAKVDKPEEFLSKWEQAQKFSEAQKNEEALSIARNDLLVDTTTAHLQAELVRLHEELARADWCQTGALPDKQDLLAELNTVTDKIQAAKELIANLQGIIKTRLEGVNNLAEVESELLAAWQEKERILKRRQALELARYTIQEVAREVQRDFAPLVNQHMGQTVSAITAGRYLASKIDHQLNIKVVVPEVGEVKDVTSLSLGTVDQIYFALRLALADLIGVKFPLLLDEPFSQYDDNRLQAVLELLAHLAEKRQILLFTCQRRELDMLRRFAPNSFQLVELSA